MLPSTLIARLERGQCDGVPVGTRLRLPPPRWNPNVPPEWVEVLTPARTIYVGKRSRPLYAQRVRVLYNGKEIEAVLHRLLRGKNR